MFKHEVRNLILSYESKVGKNKSGAMSLIEDCITLMQSSLHEESEDEALKIQRQIHQLLARELRRGIMEEKYLTYYFNQLDLALWTI